MQVKVQCAKCGQTITLVVNNIPSGMTIEDVKRWYHLCDNCDKK